MSSFKILILNGPNLNLLGKREPKHYGQKTLKEINNELTKQANDANCELILFQSNSESALIECIQKTIENRVQFIICNPAGYTHTSIVLRDALLAVNIPFIEVHLTNLHQREDFRQRSYFSDIAQGVIQGLGAMGYKFALSYAIHFLNETSVSVTNLK